MNKKSRKFYSRLLENKKAASFGLPAADYFIYLCLLNQRTPGRLVA
jgi:hypothetical protein